MARNNVAVYVWLVDTIERHGTITFEEISNLWMDCPLSHGDPMPRRTFFNYRNAIEEMFDINIQCNRSTYEYYIDDGGEEENRMHHWLLDSFSMTGMLSNSRDLSGRIVLEDVPSAREYLSLVIDAMRENKRVKFDYRAYTRVNPTKGVVLCPYFVKIFKQLWYVIGYNMADGKIKTYALDRMSDVHVTTDTFEMPKNFDPSTFFKDCYGITTTQGEAKDIVLRVSSNQAKYFRALPLHSSQQEEVHDTYSLFRYHMLLTYDFREKILSCGSNVEVLSPPELKAQVLEELKATLAQYGASGLK